jgi:kynurenine formamidase
VDLSPLVPHGFKGPPSTNIGVQFEVKTKRDEGAYWQSGQVFMSLHTGCHVESALHFYRFAGIDSALARAFALVED